MLVKYKYDSSAINEIKIGKIIQQLSGFEDHLLQY